MPAARYWRIIGIDTYAGGDLELSEIALYDGATRVDGSATLTSSVAPISGSLANLKDADTGATARFAAADVRLPGFWLMWDFGASQNITRADLQAVALNTAPTWWVLEYSTDGSTWTYYGNFWAKYTTAPFAKIEATDPDYYDYIFLREPTAGWGEFSKKYALPVNSLTYFTLNSVYSGVATSTTADAYNRGFAQYPCGETLDGDFTVEGLYFFYPIASSGPIGPFLTLAGETAAASTWGIEVLFVTSDDYRVRLIDGSGTVAINQTTGGYGRIVFFAQYHVAWTRQAGVNTLWHHGTSVGTWTDSTAINVTNIRFGGRNFDRSGWAGIKILKGRAKYTANFTAPPATTSTANDFVDMTTIPALPTVNRTTQASPSTFGTHPNPTFTMTAGVPIRFDLTDGGTATVYGTVKRDADPDPLPVARRVRLYDEVGRRFIRETWSDPVTGAFAFEGVNPDARYTAIAMDHLGQYRALISDALTAEV